MIACNGSAEGGSLGALFVAADWEVRVYGTSSIVYRLSKRLYVRTITLSECMDRCSYYNPHPKQLVPHPHLRSICQEHPYLCHHP